MHDFLRNEWKTILIVTIFCAIIYGWFYVQDREKKAEAQKPYAYTCFRPGRSLAQYALGTQKSDVELAAFAPSPSQASDFGVESWTSSNGDIVLNFRRDKLATIEFFPSLYDDETGACQRDIDEFLKSYSPIAQSIPVENRTNTAYYGAVYIERRKQDAPDAPIADPPSRTQPNSWLITRAR